MRGLAEVVRTPIMLTDIRRWREAATVHGKYFSDIRPVATFVEVRIHRPSLTRRDRDGHHHQGRPVTVVQA